MEEPKKGQVESFRFWFERESLARYLGRPLIYRRQRRFALVYRTRFVTVVLGFVGSEGREWVDDGETPTFDIVAVGGPGSLSLGARSDQDGTTSAFDPDWKPVPLDDFCEAWYRSFEKRFADIVRADSEEALALAFAQCGGTRAAGTSVMAPWAEGRASAGSAAATHRVVPDGTTAGFVDRHVRSVVLPGLMAEGYEVWEDGETSFVYAAFRGPTILHDAFTVLLHREGHLLQLSFAMAESDYDLYDPPPCYTVWVKSGRTQKVHLFETQLLNPVFAISLETTDSAAEVEIALGDLLARCRDLPAQGPA